MAAITLTFVYSISDSRIREFLLEGTRTGKLGYTAAHGQPLVAPVWFVLEDEALVFNTGAATAKGTLSARYRVETAKN